MTRQVIVSFLLSTALAGGCGGSGGSTAPRRVVVDPALGAIGPRALDALQAAMAQLLWPDNLASELRIVADTGTKLDGYVNSGDRSVLHLGPQWINAYPDATTTDLHLRVLVAHELGHMLGRDGHLTCDGDANVMAQNCLPVDARYSARDIVFICTATTGGICRR